MKNCVYLIQHKSTYKWYVGSHKDSDNIRSRSYMGSGTDITSARDIEGDDSFDSMVLIDNLDSRQDAFDVEGQILLAADARNDVKSFNKTNKTEAGGVFSVFRRKTKISRSSLSIVLNQLGKPFDDTKGEDGLVKLKREWEQLVENKNKEVTAKAYDKGYQSGVVTELDNHFDIIDTELTTYLEKSISDEKGVIEGAEAKKIAAGNIPIPALDQILRDGVNKLAYLEQELVKVQDAKGAFKLLKAVFIEEYRRGVKQFIIDSL